MASPTEITAPQLARMIGTPRAPVVIDVRTDEDFGDDPRLIPAARRCRHLEVERLASELGGQSVVVYCQKGHKLSQGAAALLRVQGVSAEALRGGYLGWRDARLPLVQTTKRPDPRPDGETLWVKRYRPKVDRIACPWLIRRFIDTRARFLFVAPDQVLDVAEKFGATPFDVEGVFWSHRGDTCSFDTFLDVFEIRTEALDRLATLVRAADTNQHELAPEAAGLLAASLGLSRMYRDDLELLDAGMTLYDAFYRWARDATGETHDWPTPGKAA